jgi:hypothetical protein
LSYSSLLFSFIQISISIWSNFICMFHTSMWKVHSCGSILLHNVNYFLFIQMLKISFMPSFLLNLSSNVDYNNHFLLDFLIIWKGYKQLIRLSPFVFKGNRCQQFWFLNLPCSLEVGVGALSFKCGGSCSHSHAFCQKKD